MLSTVSRDGGEVCSKNPLNWCRACTGTGRVVYKCNFGRHRGIDYIDCHDCGGSGKVEDQISKLLKNSL